MLDAHVTPGEVRGAVLDLIRYNWPAEERDWVRGGHEMGEAHIFTALVIANNWLLDKNDKPDDFLIE